MSFKYSAIGDNTPENREWLKKIGYEDQMIKGNSILYACNGKAYTTEPHYPSFKLIQKERVLDCRSSPALFRAVTAIRDDSDYLQWFTDRKTFVLCDKTDWLDCINHDKTFNKATLKELQEHFKLK